MRRMVYCSVGLAAAMLSSAPLAAAESVLAGRVAPPSCQAVSPAAPAPCGCKVPCEDTTPRSRIPELPYVPQEVGGYVAPPRSGTTRGATNYRGMDWGAITLPELRLRMPSFELPHFFHGRSSARMMIDSAVAPWESHGVVNAAAGRNEAILRSELERLQEDADGSPRSADERAARDAAERHLRACQDELDRLRCEVDRLRQLDDCIRDYQRRLEQNPSCNRDVDRNSPVQSRDARDYNQPPRPEPPLDNGAMRRIQPSPYMPPQATTPASHPLPAEPQYIPPQTAPVRYVESPVNYISEPQPLREPQRIFIREPQPPSARIIGVRQPQR